MSHTKTLNFYTHIREALLMQIPTRLEGIRFDIAPISASNSY